jgi:hypothetical protein
VKVAATIDISRHRTGFDLVLVQGMTRSRRRAIEQIKKGVARILVTEESRLPAFHDIRHALDLKTQIQIRMPSRRQAIQIYFDETLALSDSSPHPTVVAHLAFQ